MNVTQLTGALVVFLVSMATFRLLSWIAGGLRPKLEELKVVLFTSLIDVCCIQETFFSPEAVPDSGPSMPGFYRI